MAAHPVLVAVLSAKRIADSRHVLMSVSVDLGDGPTTFPFDYDPDDPYGITPQVTAWLAAHPDFPVSETEG